MGHVCSSSVGGRQWQSQPFVHFMTLCELKITVPWGPHWLASEPGVETSGAKACGPLPPFAAWQVVPLLKWSVANPRTSPDVRCCITGMQMF